LRGLADVEESADKYEGNLGSVSIANSDLRLIEYARSLLKALGISAKVYEQKENKFRKVIRFAIKRKQETLERVQ